jgi:hypothetical protein
MVNPRRAAESRSFVWAAPPGALQLKEGEVHLWLALWDESKPIPEATHWLSGQELLRACRSCLRLLKRW